MCILLISIIFDFHLQKMFDGNRLFSIFSFFFSFIFIIQSYSIFFSSFTTQLVTVKCSCRMMTQYSKVKYKNLCAKTLFYRLHSWCILLIFFILLQHSKWLMNCNPKMVNQFQMMIFTMPNKASHDIIFLSYRLTIERKTF